MGEKQGMLVFALAVVGATGLLLLLWRQRSRLQVLTWKLGASERRFRGLIEGSIQGILIHRRFRPLFVNDAYVTLCGFSSATEVLDLPSLEPFLPGNEAPLAWVSYIRLFEGERKAIQRRARHLRRDGAELWLEVVETLVDWGGEPALQVTVVDVTDRVRAEARAEEKTAHLSTTLDAMPAGLCLFDTRLHAILWNDRFLSLWRVDEAFLDSHPSLDALIRTAMAGGAPGGRPAEDLLLELNTYVGSGLPMLGEVPLAGGQVLEIRGARPPEGGYVLTCLDITSRRRAEETLKESERRHRMLVENLRSHILYTRTPEGRLHYISPSTAQVLGWSPEEVMSRYGPGGRPLPLPRPLAAATVAHLFPNVNASAYPLRVETAVRNRHGRKRWLSVNEMPLFDAAGDLVAMEGIAADVTERREGEAALLRAKHQAEAATAAKSAFLATMSHEIRTPMNGIMGMLEILDQTSLTQEQRRFLGVIQDSAQALLTIINDILDFSRIEAGRLRLELEPLSLPSLLNGVVDLVTPQVQRKGLELDVTLEPGLYPWRMGDPVRIRQVLLNLVGNAVKFTDQGWIRVRLGNGPGPDGVRFEVQDTGIGLDEGTRSHLFQPFQQGEPVATRHYGGSGLGLSICRRLVEMMGGEIGISGEAGPGSEFWFHLPLPLEPHGPALKEGVSAAPAGRRVRGQRWQAPERAAAEAAGAVVLVAEDNPVNRLVIQQMLERLGVALDLADDGEEAWQALQSQRYGLLITDCFMPHLDGYALTRRLRAAEEAGQLGRLPVVALTASAISGEMERCRAAGMDDYLSKPVTLAELDACLARWLPVAQTLRSPATEGQPPEEKTPVPVPDTPQILDTAFVLELFGDAEAAAPMMAYFLETTAPMLHDAAAALETGNCEEARHQAHSAAGAARTAGAHELAQLCGDLERAAVASDLPAALEVARALKGALDRVDRAIQAAFGTGAT